MLTRVTRTVRRSINRLLFSVDRETMVNVFRRLGLKNGDTVCVHARVSSLGYVKGGPNEIIEALIETVGSEGCILMPSFPTQRSMASYVDSGEVFHVRESPSRNGALPELFRQRPDVSRSLHPTNPLTGWGAGAAEILRDHDKSPTPYGHETPYGRLAGKERSFILMLGTHIHSLLHHLQERVDFPNLFLDAESQVALIDHEGSRRVIWTKVMRPRVPYFVAVPSAGNGEPDWAILHDFALIFPRSREKVVQALGYRFDGYAKISTRRQQLEREEILTAARLGRAEVGLLRVKPYVEAVEPELRELIADYRDYYDVDAILARGLTYG